MTISMMLQGPRMGILDGLALQDTCVHPRLLLRNFRRAGGGGLVGFIIGSFVVVWLN